MPLADETEALLTTRRLGRPLQAHRTLDSTNRAAQAWARAGAPEGATVLAEGQTAGRGRLGRSWASAEGMNLLFSVVLRPRLAAERLGLLPLAAGLAVADAVEEVASLEARLKWPNDVLVGGRKVCGVLLETTWPASGRPGAAVLGIGLNVNQRSFPDELDRATSLLLEAGRPVARAPLLAALLARLERRYDALQRGETDALLHDYEQRLDGLGQPATFFTPGDDTPVRGTLDGVDATGALRLLTADGVQTFHAGEVTTHQGAAPT